MSDRPSTSACAPPIETGEVNEASSGCLERLVRILLVDDDPAILDALSSWLELECGAEVIACTSAEQAMRSTAPGCFDVCILDYQLTGVNGLTLGAMLREINPATRLILLSGNLSPTVKTLASEHGFGRIFSKPVSPRSLVDAIVC